jgi:hypothetical protein
MQSSESSSTTFHPSGPVSSAEQANKNETRSDDYERTTSLGRVEGRHDAAGDEHVVATFPNGTKSYMRNGVELPISESPDVAARSPPVKDA